MFLDYARIAYSSLVFCGASTFCFWPAMANTNGTVVLPVTPLLGGKFICYVRYFTGHFLCYLCLINA